MCCEIVQRSEISESPSEFSEAVEYRGRIPVWRCVVLSRCFDSPFFVDAFRIGYWPAFCDEEVTSFLSVADDDRKKLNHDHLLDGDRGTR